MFKSPFSFAKSHCRVKSNQQGMAIIEVLVATLIFSFGVVGLIGLQTRMTQVISESTLTAELSDMSQTYINQIWAVTPANRMVEFQGGASYAAFSSRLNQRLGSAYVGPPAVIVTAPVAMVPGQSDQEGGRLTITTVTISIQYQLPNSPARTFRTQALVF